MIQPQYSYNVLDPDCPSRQALALLADKWVLLVIVSLAHRQPQRNGELKRSISDISQKMLIQTLRQLEEKGIVSRTVYDEVPPHVEYQLTPLGESLLTPLDALKTWAEANCLALETIRSREKRL